MIRRWEFGNKRNRCKARPQQHARVESRGAGGAQAPCGGSGGGRGGRRGPARALAQQLEGVKGASIRAAGRGGAGRNYLAFSRAGGLFAKVCVRRWEGAGAPRGGEVGETAGRAAKVSLHGHRVHAAGCRCYSRPCTAPLRS